MEFSQIQVASLSEKKKKRSFHYFFYGRKRGWRM